MGLDFFRYRTVGFTKIKDVCDLEKELKAIQDTPKELSQQKAQYIYQNKRLFEMAFFDVELLQRLAILLSPQKALILIASKNFYEVHLKTKDLKSAKGYLDKISSKHENPAITKACEGLIALIRANAIQKEIEHAEESKLIEAHAKHKATIQKSLPSEESIDLKQLGKLNLQEEQKANVGRSRKSLFSNIYEMSAEPVPRKKQVDAKKENEVTSGENNLENDKPNKKQREKPNRSKQGIFKVPPYCHCDCGDYRYERYLVWSPPFSQKD